jgi:hypothetical protein
MCEITVVLARRAGRICLVRRPESRSVMPGMWELPELQANGRDVPVWILKHTIMNTTFRVGVVCSDAPIVRGQWIKGRRAASLPLTGMTRKILLRAGVI